MMYFALPELLVAQGLVLAVRGLRQIVLERRMTSIRRATLGDAAALAALAEKIFRESFGLSNASEDLNAHCAEHFGESQQSEEILDSEMLTVVAEVDGDLVGYGQLRAKNKPPCVRGANSREIYRLYVDGRWHGMGIAPLLMQTLIEAAGAAGADTVWLGVWEHNPRAIAFYEKSGFTVVGDHRFLLGSDSQRDIVMERSALGD